MKKDLEEVRAALADSKVILEKFRAENEKLSAKASLEDEVVTLATSLQSAREEIRFAKFSSIAEYGRKYKTTIILLENFGILCFHAFVMSFAVVGPVVSSFHLSS